VRPETPAAAPVVLGDGLLLAGLVWSVWAVRTLGRSFSVIPQARAVVSAGPYRVVRHPLYLGEIVATLGLAVVRPSAETFGAWVLLCVLQAFRAAHEERLLAATLPDYDGYRRCTRRHVPGQY
jgi:protein-S-isoprenylcysteine O-methyltransferase Ste14